MRDWVDAVYRMQMTGMRQLAVPGCLMLITVLALAEVKQKPWTYRASVFAHRPLLPSETFPVSRAIAVKNMMKNVVIYRQQAQHAAKQVRILWSSWDGSRRVTAWSLPSWIIHVDNKAKDTGIVGERNGTWRVYELGMVDIMWHI